MATKNPAKVKAGKIGGSKKNKKKGFGSSGKASEAGKISGRIRRKKNVQNV